METEYNGVRVWHSWFSTGSIVQDIVTYAYKLGGFDFVAVLECENWQFKLDAVGDSGHAFWLCQVNNRYHKDIPADYTTNWVVAVEYCYQKFKDWTLFYWPGRIIKGTRTKCYDYIKPRYTFIE